MCSALPSVGNWVIKIINFRSFEKLRKFKVICFTVRKIYTHPTAIAVSPSSSSSVRRFKRGIDHSEGENLFQQQHFSGARICDVQFIEINARTNRIIIFVSSVPDNTIFPSSFDKLRMTRARGKNFYFLTF